MLSSMFEMTFENHFQFGRLPEDIDTFAVSCGLRQRQARSPLEEAALAAIHIYETSPNKNIQLCLSGGIDSEAMALSFLKAKIPFEAVFLRFQNNLNEFDIKTNIEFCQQNNIKITFVDLDIIRFLESGLCFEIADKYESQSPQLCSHLWLMDQLDGFPVLGGNPIAPIWRKDKWYYVGLPGELHSVYFKNLLINERAGAPFFFLYSPELISSFFHVDVMKNYISKNVQNETGYSYLDKCLSYQQGGFAVKPRQDKFTGFELVRQHYDHFDGTEHGIAFDRRFRAPLVESFPFPENYIQMIPQNYFEI